ncbi:MAG: site-specific integrase [Candidatus Altiarchaeota archaeon]|nr:site-specific integrase [Candidatus Altiarchaeota archaeon]
MENPRIEEKELDIHHRKKSLENTKRILKQSKIGSRNKTLILEYVRSKVLGESIGVARQEKLIRHLRILAEHLGRQFDKAAKSDIEKLVEKLYSSEVKWGERKKKISEWSKYDYVVILKGFFQWLKNCKEPEETSWIKPPRPRPKRLKPADIISWEDAVAMSKAATNPRDRCLPLILWGSGLRIQELLTLKLKDVEQVNGGEAVILHLRQSKTDERDPLVVRGAAALLDWMHYHPLGDNENSYLFVNLQNNRPLEYPQTRLKLKELAKRAKIEKDVNPHAFSKASASPCISKSLWFTLSSSGKQWTSSCLLD